MTAAAVAVDATHNPESPSTAPLVMAGVLVATPVWYEYLKTVSAVAAEIAPIVGLGIGLATLWHVARGSNRDVPADASSAGGLIGVVGALARRGGLLALVGITIAGILVALYTVMRSERRHDVYGIISPNGAQSARKRKAADEAGDDGDVEVDVPEGGPKWLKLARAEIGVKEWKGRRHNPRILAYWTDAGGPQFDTDETPWCAAFVNAMLERSGVRGTKAGLARSFENWGKKIETPRLGCAVVFWRNSRKSGSGHVGFFIGYDGAGRLLILGGNQSDGVSVAAFSDDKVLSYRWPTNRLMSPEVVAGAGAAGGAATAGGAVVVSEAAKTPPAPPVDPSAGNPPDLSAIEAARGPLQELAQFVPYAAAAAAVIGLGCAVYLIYWKFRRG